MSAGTELSELERKIRECRKKLAKQEKLGAQDRIASLKATLAKLEKRLADGAGGDTEAVSV